MDCERRCVYNNVRWGYNTWRDPLKPTVILEKMCKSAGLDPPVYQPGCVVVAEQPFYEQETVETEEGLYSLSHAAHRRGTKPTLAASGHPAARARGARLVLAPAV